MKTLLALMLPALVAAGCGGSASSDRVSKLEQKVAKLEAQNAALGRALLSRPRGPRGPRGARGAPGPPSISLPSKSYDDSALWIAMGDVQRTLDYLCAIGLRVYHSRSDDPNVNHW